MIENQMSASDILMLAIDEPAVYLETFCELDGAPLSLEPYQIRFLNDRSAFRLVNKARQIGYSTIIAAESFHSAAVAPLLRKSYEANIVSVNRKEAGSKIEIVRRLFHSIPEELNELGLKPILWNDSEYEITFGRTPYQGSLISQPASAAIRGGRKDIIFDEFAHIRDSKKLYQAALPAISRGNSRITIISTPLGQSGLFYDIAVDVDAYPEYSRHVVPWWESKAMIKPGLYPEALAAAAQRDDGSSDMKDLSTEERIQKFGSDKLNSIFRSFGSDLISFQTEYEATFVDETEAFFPWDLIVDCRNDDLTVWTDWPENYEPKGWLTIGMDLAKERDQTVVTIAEVVEEANEVKRTIKFAKPMRRSYDDQFNYLSRLIKQARPSRISIDATGVGGVFVERAKREIPNSNIEAVVFSNQKKEKWATQFKGDMQLDNIEYPAIPDLMKQIHGIRRTKTEGGFFKFAGAHDDFFWSAILALYGEGRVPAKISFV